MWLKLAVHLDVMVIGKCETDIALCPLEAELLPEALQVRLRVAEAAPVAFTAAEIHRLPHDHPRDPRLPEASQHGEAFHLEEVCEITHAHLCSRLTIHIAEENRPGAVIAVELFRERTPLLRDIDLPDRHTLSCLLDFAGIDVGVRPEVVDLAPHLENDRAWARVNVGAPIIAGDVGVFISNSTSDLHHIYLVIDATNQASPTVANNQGNGSHQRPVAGGAMPGIGNGASPTTYFLRAT